MGKKRKKFISTVKEYLLFPHTLVCICIVIFAIVAIVLSSYFDKHDLTFASSILSNIFAGLVTGLIIYLISGVKQIYIYITESKLAWLKKISCMILDYKNLYRELLTLKKFDDTIELWDFIYDVGSHANWVNDEIIQSSFDRKLSFSPREYVKNQFEYDAMEYIEIFNDLHENLKVVDLERMSKRDVIGLFEAVNKKMQQLHSKILTEISNIEIKLCMLNKSII